MKTKVQIVIYQQGGEYFSTLTLENNIPNFSPPGKIFSMTEEIEPSQFQDFRNRAKEEAQKRGIPHVVNLY